MLGTVQQRGVQVHCGQDCIYLCCKRVGFTDKLLLTLLFPSLSMPALAAVIASVGIPAGQQEHICCDCAEPECWQQAHTQHGSQGELAGGRGFC